MIKNKQKKLAYLIPSLDIGGAEHQTVNQINFLVEQGFNNVFLIILSNKVDLIKELKLQKNNILIIEWNDFTILNFKSTLRLFSLANQVSKFIKSQGVTHVIAVLPLAHLVSRMTKAKLTITFRKRFTLSTYYRGLYFKADSDKGVVKRIFNYFNSFLAYNFDNSTIFISQAVYKDIKNNFFIRNSMVLPNSLPVKNISDNLGKQYLKRNLILEKEKYLILVPGRLQMQKGHLFFLNAISFFIKKNQISYDDLKIIIAGDGIMRYEIEKKIDELRLNNFFFLTGFVDNELMLSLYKCVNLVVIPSIREGFGNVAIEGLMQKTQMLVSDTDGLPEIIKDYINGFTFVSENVEDFEKKLSYIHRNREKELLSKEVLYQDFMNNYTIERQVKKILDFIGIGNK